MAYLLENFPSVSDFDEAHRDIYSYAFANLGMLLASEDPDEDSNIGYCEFETAPDLRAHLDGMKSLQRLSGDLFVPRRESVGRERIEAVLDVVKQCMGDLDWHGDWSEEEWVLVHYWAKHDEEETA